MPLLIVGASARAAAQSARRAGHAPIAHDLFADRDLVATCADHDAHRIPSGSYPAGLAAIAAETKSGGFAPWIYTGALENHPDLIDRIAAIRPLWGISGRALRSVRDPLAVADTLMRRGLLAPGVRDSAVGLPRDGSWLTKPIASAGGRGIRPIVEGVSVSTRRSYFQERIDGESLAAIFVGVEGRSSLLGVTKQILGRPDEPFAYVGSIGPWPLNRRAREEIDAIGAALVDAFGLLGLFGVDLVLTADERPVAIEVNSRYTASVEVLELASGRPFLVEHRRAFESVSDPARTRLRPPSFVGKAILFAEARSTAPALDRWRPRPHALASFAVPTVADVPEIGTVFEPGDPVMTVMARGSTLASCERRLSRRLDRWRMRLQLMELR